MLSLDKLSGVSFSRVSEKAGHCAKPAEAPEAADWIIIGGGASGCAAAAALVDAGEDVLVLERGQSDLDAWLRSVGMLKADTTIRLH